MRIVTIPQNTAQKVDYDFVFFKDQLKELGLDKFKEGVDYEFEFERGDDFPAKVLLLVFDTAPEITEIFERFFEN